MSPSSFKIATCVWIWFITKQHLKKDQRRLLTELCTQPSIYLSHHYNALVTPCFNTVALSGAKLAGLFDKLQKVQNRAARIVTLSGYENRSSDLLDGLGWKRLENFRLKQLAVLMYKIHNNLSPLYLKQIFNKISTVHTHSLGNSEPNYFIPRRRTEYTKGILHYRCSVLWDRIPLEIRHVSSLISRVKYWTNDWAKTCFHLCQ